MKSLEPWLNRTVLRTVAGYCGSYGSVLKKIIALNGIVLGYILTRKQISTVKEFEKQKTEKRKNEKGGEIAKKKKNHITSVDHGNALPLIDRFSFFPFISFGFLKTFFTSSLPLCFTSFFFFGLLLRLFHLLPF